MDAKVHVLNHFVDSGLSLRSVTPVTAEHGVVSEVVFVARFSLFNDLFQYFPVLSQPRY